MSNEAVLGSRGEYAQEEQQEDFLYENEGHLDRTVQNLRRDLREIRFESQKQGKWTPAKELALRSASALIDAIYGIRSQIFHLQEAGANRRLEGLRDKAHGEAIVEDDERTMKNVMAQREVDEAHESAQALERRHEELQQRATQALEELLRFEEKQLGLKPEVNGIQPGDRAPERKALFE